MRIAQVSTLSTPVRETNSGSVESLNVAAAAAVLLARWRHR